MKTIVTHISPDLDAICSIWLITRYFPGWKKAQIKFVPAGLTLNNALPDSHPDIIHVDTGSGRFDHHQLADYYSASQRVFDFLAKNNYLSPKELPAIERIINLVTAIDNFYEVFFPDPTADIYDLTLYQLIDGLKLKHQDDQKVTTIVLDLLDSLLIVFKNKLKAEKEIKSALIFRTKYGKSLACETANDEVMKLAQKQGYRLVIRRDPKTGCIRIKARPKAKIDLTPVYHQLKKKDPQATWFLHSTKRMLLNGSLKNPGTKPSSLSLNQIIEIIKRI